MEPSGMNGWSGTRNDKEVVDFTAEGHIEGVSRYLGLPRR
jgi:hypothetical protein